ncbi:hypothetical protein [Vibrio owensii]|uniref:hypothetical protein n=1 Tax=Vibrio owensii TaxID=696485 RepID=UPI000596D34C|nr:hypothetical protein [Vibrio owensii]
MNATTHDARHIKNFALIAQDLGFNVDSAYFHDWDIDPFENDGERIHLNEDLLLCVPPYHVVSRDYLVIGGRHFHPHVDYAVSQDALQQSVMALVAIHPNIN